LISIDLWGLEIDLVDFSKFRIKLSKISVQQEIIFGMAMFIANCCNYKDVSETRVSADLLMST